VSSAAARVTDAAAEADWRVAEAVDFAVARVSAAVDSVIW